MPRLPPSRRKCRFLELPQSFLLHERQEPVHIVCLELRTANHILGCDSCGSSKQQSSSNCFQNFVCQSSPHADWNCKCIPAAPSAAPVLGLQLAKRHWSIEPTEAWVVQPSEPPTPATWPQKVLHSGVYIVEAAGALSGVALCAIVGGWRTAKSLYQNRRPLQQECTMAVVTGYRAAKRRLVTSLIRRPEEMAAPALSLPLAKDPRTRRCNGWC